jgi:hypothetical protein
LWELKITVKLKYLFEMDRERTMNLASINAMLIILTVSLTTISSGLFQAATALFRSHHPQKMKQFLQVLP